MERASEKTKALARASRLVQSAVGFARVQNYEKAYTEAQNASLILLDQLENEQPVAGSVDEGISDSYWQRYLVRNNNYSLNGVIIDQKIKESLIDAIMLPLLYSRAYTQGAKPKKAILLSGPCGTGKTALVAAVSNYITSNFGPINLLSIQASAIMSKWAGQAEARVDSLFDFAARNTPCIIFIDECDSFFSKKKDSENDGSTRCRNTFIQRLSGMSDLPIGVTVLASTNKPMLLDTAFHSRFDKEFCIGLPSKSQRAEILKIRMQSMRNALSENDYRKIAQITHGYSGRDLEQVMTQAQDMQYNKLKDNNYYLLKSCSGDGNTHFSSCWYFNTGMPCQAIPVEPNTPGCTYMHWIMAKNIAIPPPISLKDMEHAVSFCHKTTTDMDMLELEVYYTEKMIPFRVLDKD